MVKLEIGNKVAAVIGLLAFVFLLTQYPTLADGFVEQLVGVVNWAFQGAFDGLSWGIQENDLKLMIQLAVIVGIVGFANLLGIRSDHPGPLSSGTNAREVKPQDGHV